MAFAVETIETPERRAEFDAFKFTFPASGRPAESKRWVVDRDRNLFFAGLGGGAFEMPYFFRLVSKEGVIADCEGTYQVMGKDEVYPDGLNVVWSVSLIEIPKAQKDRVEEVLAWLREAFLAYGYLCDPELTKSSSVNLTAPRLV